jgi:hypothetical protein
MRGFMPPWRGARLKHRDNFTFYLVHYSIAISEGFTATMIQTVIFWVVTPTALSQLPTFSAVAVYHLVLSHTENLTFTIKGKGKVVPVHF